MPYLCCTKHSSWQSSVENDIRASLLELTATLSFIRGARFFSDNISKTKYRSMAKKRTITVELNRNSITGQFVTAEYAEKHPKTTQTEHRKKKIG